ANGNVGENYVQRMADPGAVKKILGTAGGGSTFRENTLQQLLQLVFERLQPILASNLADQTIFSHGNRLLCTNRRITMLSGSRMMSSGRELKPEQLAGCDTGWELMLAAVLHLRDN